MTWKETEFISLSINTATRLVAPIFHQVSCAELRTAAVGLILGLAMVAPPPTLLCSISSPFKAAFPRKSTPAGATWSYAYHVLPPLSGEATLESPSSLDAARQSEVIELLTLGPPRPEVTTPHRISLQEEFAQPPRLA